MTRAVRLRCDCRCAAAPVWTTRIGTKPPLCPRGVGHHRGPWTAQWAPGTCCPSQLGLCHLCVFGVCWCVGGCKHSSFGAYKNVIVEQMSLCCKSLAFAWQSLGTQALLPLSLNGGWHFVKLLHSKTNHVGAYLLQRSGG